MGMVRRTGESLQSSKGTQQQKAFLHLSQYPPVCFPAPPLAPISQAPHSTPMHLGLSLQSLSLQGCAPRQTAELVLLVQRLQHPAKVLTALPRLSPSS